MARKVLNQTGGPVGNSSFSKDRYISSAWMEREWEWMWTQCWLLAGLESDLARPGDFFVFELGREQILVTRSSDTTVKAFYNVCQHRGNRLVGTERGHADSFRCAYHAWTYAVDGRLTAVPHREEFASLPCAERSLRPVHAAVWDGLVFVCMADDPPTLEEYLAPLPDLLAPYRFRNMTVTQDQTVHHHCNWKAVVDNFSELYHTDFLHPQLRTMSDCTNDTMHLFDNGHSGVQVWGATVNPRFPIPDEPTDLQRGQLENLGLDPADFKGRVLEVRQAVQQRKRDVGRRHGYDYSRFTDDQLSDIWIFNVFPNAVLSFSSEHLWIMRPRPHPTDPHQCYFDKISLLLYAEPHLNDGVSADAGWRHKGFSGPKPADYVRPERDAFDHVDVVKGDKSLTPTIDQDIELLGRVQAGMASRGFDRVWLSDEELRVQHFHARLDRLIGE